MSELTRFTRSPWSIFDELAGIQDEFNRVFGDWDTGRGYGRRRVGVPPMNVWASDNGVIVDVELPGVEPADVDIQVVGDELVLKGTFNHAEAGNVSPRCERPHGAFERTLQLPFRADTGKVTANYRNGILRITVPRSEEEKPRKVAVEAA